MSARGCARGASAALVAVFLAAVTLPDVPAATISGPKIPPAVMAKLKKYDSRYYVIYSDLDPEKVETVVARLTSVAEEYHERTKGYASGAITSRWPFFVMANAEDYRAAGGQAHGVAWGDRLMALVTPATADEIWHVIQHEAFHQFSHNVISETLPGWVDEGMAEYFGESLWRGDGLACGIIPPNRYARILPRTREGKIRPFREIILIKGSSWSGIEDYDQAWTMIHFFVHAENGKYQKALGAYIKATAAGAAWDEAFAKCFGRNIDAIQKEYTAYWADAERQTESDRAYVQATVATLASYLARAHTQGQKFQSAEEFFAAAKDRSLKKHPKQPLPDDLLKDALDRADKLKTWSLDASDKGLPRLILTADDGTAFTATFTLKDGKVEKVRVTVERSRS